ncbi:MAG: hypothetical protein LBT50_11510 [Prevotellaceae bacterium]|jgi:hypothetical protein|nr:hypothetical protein [Prevotellaceae bacterium]
MGTKKLTEKKKAKEGTSKKPRKSAKKAVSGKKKLVVSYKNLAPELVDLVKEKYPKGYSDFLLKVNKGNGDFFYAITLDTEAADYLIKVDVKIDSEMEEVEKALFEHQDSVDDDFPDDSAPFVDDGDDE